MLEQKSLPPSPPALSPRRLPLAPEEVQGGEIPAGVGERHPPDGWRLADPYPLGAGSIRRFHAIVAAVLPPEPAPRPPGIEGRIVEHVRRMMRYMPRVMAGVGIPLLLLILEWSPLWCRGRLRRLSSLPPADGCEVLTAVAESRFLLVRMLMLAPKALVLSTYFDQEEVHRALAYEPRTFFADRIALRARLAPGTSAVDRTAAPAAVAFAAGAGR